MWNGEGNGGAAGERDAARRRTSPAAASRDGDLRVGFGSTVDSHVVFSRSSLCPPDLR